MDAARQCFLSAHGFPPALRFLAASISLAVHKYCVFAPSLICCGSGISFDLNHTYKLSREIPINFAASDVVYVFDMGTSIAFNLTLCQVDCVDSPHVELRSDLLAASVPISLPVPLHARSS